MEAKRRQQQTATPLPKPGWVSYVAFGALAIGMLAVANHDWASRRDAAIAWAIVVGCGAAIFVTSVRSMITSIGARRMAARLYENWRLMNAGPHEYRCLEVSELETCELEYFESLQPEFESRGLHYLADMLNVTASPFWPTQRQVHRILLSEDGALRVTIDQSVILIQGRPPACMAQRVLVTTELTDGRFLTSNRVQDASNDAANADDSAVPEIEWHQKPADCKTQEFLRSHRRRVQTLTRSNPGLKPVVMKTVDDVTASLTRMQLLINQQVRPIDLAEHFCRGGVSDRKAARFLRLMGEELSRLQACRKCGFNLTGNTTGTCPECATPVPVPNRPHDFGAKAGVR